MNRFGNDKSRGGFGIEVESDQNGSRDRGSKSNQGSEILGPPAYNAEIEYLADNGTDFTVQPVQDAEDVLYLLENEEVNCVLFRDLSIYDEKQAAELRSYLEQNFGESEIYHSDKDEFGAIVYGKSHGALRPAEEIDYAFDQ
jgi:hypothetical protein